jgi:hypothetical protein
MRVLYEYPLLGFVIKFTTVFVPDKNADRRGAKEQLLDRRFCPAIPSVNLESIEVPHDFVRRPLLANK